MRTRLQWILFFVLVGLIFGWMGYTDRQDEIAEARHTAEILDEARQQTIHDAREAQFLIWQQQAASQLNLKGIK